jgi:DNA-binding response OmpR family regulator
MTHRLTTKKAILIIEDERPLVQVIEAKLLKAGFDVVTARTVDQGLDYMENVGAIDAIWLDHYLSGEKTGIDFVAELKSSDSRWLSVPIFVVSNTASRDNLQSYTRLGVNKYSIKADHRLDEITNEIKSFLEKNQTESRPS